MIKKTFLAIALLPVFFLCSAQDKFYVAVNGNDNNPGTIVKPLKTLHMALDKVATAKTKKVSILLRAGKYAPGKTIEITPGLLNNHQLEISAYNNEKVIVSGALKTTPQWKLYKGKVLQASIGSGLTIDQLFCNGKALPLARYPNYDKAAPFFHGTAADAISPQRVKNWADPTGGYVHALHQAEWGDFHYRITGKTDKDSLLLEGGWQNNRPAPMHKEHRFVENIFEELDAPGEWFYNTATGIIYLYPSNGINLKTALFERSVLDDIIHIKGSEQESADNVTIKGIEFTGTNRTFMLTKEPLLRSDWTIYRGGALLSEGAKNINISNCTFTALGGHAVFVSKYNRNIAIEHNYIHHIGGNAIAFVGDTAAVRSPSFRYEDFVPVDKMDMTPGPKTNNYPAGCMVYDNLIHTIGMIEKQVAAVEISMAMEITVRHNSIYDVPRAGINIGSGAWGGHIFEYNDVFDTVQETGDHGSFNSWGRDRFWHPNRKIMDEMTATHPELIGLDAQKTVKIHNNRFRCDHGWDIDLDDGSSNYHIYNNLCLNGGIKLREGFYRKVENNIMINNSFHPHVWFNNSSDVFKHNIVQKKYFPIVVNDWGNNIDLNAFPDESALADAQKNKTDLHSIVLSPEFENPVLGDFRVKANSKIFEIGFKNFHMDNFGVTSPKLKQLARQPKIPDLKINDLLANKSAIIPFMGGEIRAIEGLGDRSAYGLPDEMGVLLVNIGVDNLLKKSGLEKGDVIRNADSKTLKDLKQLLDIVQSSNWKPSIPIEVIRNQKILKLDLILK